MIDVRNLTKLYGPTHSLDGLTFHVGEGEVLGLLGPNGAGKTTTMRILAGLARPSSGSATVAGHDPARDHLAVRRVLGYLPEDSPLYPEMRVEQYLAFIAKMKNVASAQIKPEINRVLDEVKLDYARGRLVGNMSKGMKQRLGLAQALLGDPKIVILDEPSVGLDPNQIQELRKLIRDMQGKRTVVLSTHVLENVAVTCTKVVIINEGKTVAQGSVEEIGKALGGRRIELRARGALNKIREAAEAVCPVDDAVHEKGVTKLTIHPMDERDFRPALARAVVEAGYDLIELHEATPTLDDVFLRATASISSDGDS